MSPNDEPGRGPDPAPGQSKPAGVTGSDPGCGSFHTARDRRNQRRLNAWIIAASLVYLGATAALRWQARLPGGPVLAWALTGGFALMAVEAARRWFLFLRQADELLRRIQLEALALACGVGLVLSLLYPLLEDLGLPRVGGRLTAMAMMLALVLGSWLGTRRYSGRSEAGRNVSGRYEE